MRRSIDIRCPAKINLFLDVGERRTDGFHRVTTIIQAIDLYDELRLEDREEGGISLRCEGAAVPRDSGNLCWRAADLLRRESGTSRGVRLSLKKRIPVAAGLGGGSSDAAGALLGLDRLWGLGLSIGRLRELASRLGSDVPFFIEGGTGYCTGRGERVKSITDARGVSYVLVTPRLRISTACVYESMKGGPEKTGSEVQSLIRLIRSPRPAGVAAILYNRLEESESGHMKVVRRLKKMLLSHGALGACMSGSGPSVFGLAEEPEAAREIERKVRREAGQGLFCHSGMTNVRPGYAFSR